MSDFLHIDCRDLNAKRLLKLRKSTTSAWQLDIIEFIIDWLDAKPTLDLKSSGTTGTPKVFEAQKCHLRKSALRTGKFFNLNKGQSILLNLPTDFVAGKMIIVRAIELKLQLIAIEQTNNIDQYPNQMIDFAALVPFQLNKLLGSKEGRKVLNNFKTLIVGGGAIGNDTISKLSSEITTQIFHTYGMTETFSHVAIKQIHPKPDRSFKAVENVTFEVDQNDCLIINDKDLELEHLYTNDIVKLIDQHSFEWISRADNVINTGGVKVYPEKIESIIAKHIPHQFFIAASPSPSLGEQVTLYHAGPNNIDLELLNLKLSKFQKIKHQVIVQHIETTSSGKIKRNLTIANLNKNR